jgi:hypothetical protein
VPPAAHRSSPKRRRWRRNILTALAALLVLSVIFHLAGGSPVNWYANGKQYRQAVDQASGGSAAMIDGVRPTTVCDAEVRMKTSVLPTNAPPLSDSSAVQQWVNGCLAGMVADG